MVEEKLKIIEDVMKFQQDLIGDHDLDQNRQDGMREIYYDRIIPRLDALEEKLAKLIQIMEKVIQYVS